MFLPISLVRWWSSCRENEEEQVGTIRAIEGFGSFRVGRVSDKLSGGFGIRYSM